MNSNDWRRKERDYDWKGFERGESQIELLDLH